MDKISGSPVPQAYTDIRAAEKQRPGQEDSFDTLLSTATEKVTLNGSPGQTSIREGKKAAKPSSATPELSGPTATSAETLSAAAVEGTASVDAPYRFASKYSIEEIMTDPVKARAFEHDYLAGESAYYAMARDPESGLTYDGYSLDVKTGEPVQARDWSAPSKECLDIAVLTKAVMGDPKAALVVAKGDLKKAADEAAAILEKKIGSYEKFYEQYPGFGGFLPWFKVGKEISPVDNWKTAAPGLDNGELVWALLAAEYALKKSGRTELAERYHKYNEMLRDNVVKMFYDVEAGKVRADVTIHDPQSADSTYETSINKPGLASYLSGEDGVHEGQMMLLYVSLLGKGLPESASDKIWSGTNMTRIEHKFGTTWRGCWGSSHESWAHLYLPTRDIPEFNDLFRIREEIRSQNAAERGYPGFATSAGDPASNGYLDSAGVEGVGILECRNNHIYTIYGAFPMLMEFSDKDAKGNYGLAWLLNMLKGQKMQNPVGGGESATNDGKHTSNLKTVDGTLPNIIALTGGLGRETGEMLKEMGLYNKFKAILENEYKEAFGSEPLHEPCGFALPTKAAPTNEMPDYEKKTVEKSEIPPEAAPGAKRLEQLLPEAVTYTEDPPGEELFRASIRQKKS